MWFQSTSEFLYFIFFYLFAFCDQRKPFVDLLIVLLSDSSCLIGLSYPVVEQQNTQRKQSDTIPIK